MTNPCLYCRQPTDRMYWCEPCSEFKRRVAMYPDAARIILAEVDHERAVEEALERAAEQAAGLDG